jgi:hypothetical protein
MHVIFNTMGCSALAHEMLFHVLRDTGMSCGTESRKPLPSSHDDLCACTHGMRHG